MGSTLFRHVCCLSAYTCTGCQLFTHKRNWPHIASVEVAFLLFSTAYRLQTHRPRHSIITFHELIAVIRRISSKQCESEWHWHWQWFLDVDYSLFDFPLNSSSSMISHFRFATIEHSTNLLLVVYRCCPMRMSNQILLLWPQDFVLFFPERISKNGKTIDLSIGYSIDEMIHAQEHRIRWVSIFVVAPFHAIIIKIHRCVELLSLHYCTSHLHFCYHSGDVHNLLSFVYDAAARPHWMLFVVDGVVGFWILSFHSND